MAREIHVPKSRHDQNDDHPFAPVRKEMIEILLEPVESLTVAGESQADSDVPSVIANRPERFSVTVESQSDGDIRSTIAKRVIGEGFDLYEMRAIRITLEDIFLQLTTEEREATPEAAAAAEAAV